jgi:hypothetical protein
MANLLRIVPIDRVDVCMYTVPTDAPESDGTLEWNQTTLVLVEASGGGQRGISYTYADAATAPGCSDPGFRAGQLGEAKVQDPYSSILGDEDVVARVELAE